MIALAWAVLASALALAWGIQVALRWHRRRAAIWRLARRNKKEFDPWSSS